jgi:hypothetical protein
LQSAIVQVRQLKTDAVSIVKTCVRSPATISSADVLKMSHLHTSISSHLDLLGKKNSIEANANANADEEKDQEPRHGWRKLERKETMVDAGNTHKTSVLQELDRLNESVRAKGRCHLSASG